MSWLETLTSTPVVIAGLVGISAALFVGRRDPARVSEQVKEVANATQADVSKAKMAQAVRQSVAWETLTLVSPRRSCLLQLHSWLRPRSAIPFLHLFVKPALTPVKDDPISVAELSAHDGRDAAKPIYVAIKGKVFDVSPKREMYGPGAGYNIFAGKDASKGLGKLSA